MAAQDLEVLNYGSLEIVRTKDFMNLILEGDTTNVDFLLIKRVALYNIFDSAYIEKSEAWLADCAERIFKKNKEIKELLKKGLQNISGNIALYLYYDREGKVAAIQFIWDEPVFNEAIRKPLCEFQKLIMKEKVNFTEFPNFSEKRRYAFSMFNITRLVLENKIKLE